MKHLLTNAVRSVADDLVETGVRKINYPEFRTLGDVKLDSDGKRLEGYAIVYESMSEPLPLRSGQTFREVIRKGAAAEAIKAPDIRALYEHDYKSLLGRTSSGTLQLSEDQRGVHYSLDLPNTRLGQDVREMVARGDIRGASFHLKVPKGADKWTKQQDGMLREISRLEIGEISLVSTPAYPETSAALRSYSEWEAEQLLSRGLLLSLRLKQVHVAEM